MIKFLATVSSFLRAKSALLGFLLLASFGGALPAYAVENPWGDNALGEEQTGLTWNATLGYHFTPNTDGEVVELGGLFEGTKWERLWDFDTGT